MYFVRRCWLCPEQAMCDVWSAVYCLCVCCWAMMLLMMGAMLRLDLASWTTFPRIDMYMYYLGLYSAVLWRQPASRASLRWAPVPESCCQNSG